MDPEITKLTKRLERERSARKAAEKIAEKGLRDLFLANQDLDQKVETRTEELKESRAQYQSAAQDRQQFLSALSRQTRTPLNGVIGMLELLTDHLNTEQELLWANTGLDSSKDLLRLFTRLVQYVELGEGTIYDNEEVLVSHLLNKVSESWTDRATKNKKLLVLGDSTSADSAILTNESLAVSLLDEIVENSIKHSDPGAIKVEASDHTNSKVIGAIQFKISDPGPGAIGENSYLSSQQREKTDSLGAGYKLINMISNVIGADVSQEVTDSNFITTVTFK